MEETLLRVNKILDERKDEMPIVSEDHELGKRVQKENIDGKPTLLCTQSFDGVTVE